MPSVRVVDPPEKADLALVNAGRATRGQAPLAASLRWTCQHSCPEETIPACDRFDCEGTLIDDDSPLLPERYAIQHGDVSACKALRVTVCIADVDCDANELIRVVARYAGSEKLDVHPGSASSICIVFEAPAHVRNHPYGLGAEPGQYLGPDARVVVRVDTDSARGRQIGESIIGARRQPSSCDRSIQHPVTTGNAPDWSRRAVFQGPAG